jgi:hypothetical protein
MKRSILQHFVFVLFKFFGGLTGQGFEQTNTGRT